MNQENTAKSEEWWDYELPATPYELVGNNKLTRLIRPFLYIVIQFYFKRFHSVKVYGYKSLFSKHPYIIIANHSSHLDTPLIFSCFKLNMVNKIRAVAALDYFFSNPIVRVATHLLCNIIPINRKSADFTAISMCKKVLQSGGSIIIYPEGTRTRNGKMAEFKPGVGILIKKTKSPVLPVFIKGTYNCFNHKRAFPCSGPIEILFGKPIEFNALFSAKPGLKEIAMKLREAVIKASQLTN